MKFFKITFLLSSFLFVSSAYPCDVQDIPEPSHQLCFQYSTRHNQQPKNVDPNTSYLTQEIPVAITSKSALSISLQEYLRSRRADIQHVDECDLYSQRLLGYEHSRYHKFVSASPGSDIANLLGEHYSDTWLPIRYDNTNYLWNENFYDILPSRKFKTFIETKVTAMKLQGFNL